MQMAAGPSCGSDATLLAATRDWPFSRIARQIRLSRFFKAKKPESWWSLKGPWQKTELNLATSSRGMLTMGDHWWGVTQVEKSRRPPGHRSSRHQHRAPEVRRAFMLPEPQENWTHGGQSTGHLSGAVASSTCRWGAAAGREQS